MQLGEEAAAHDATKARVTELQRSFTEEVDYLIGQLQVVRAASESEVRTIFQCLIPDADCVN